MQMSMRLDSIWEIARVALLLSFSRALPLKKCIEGLFWGVASPISGLGWVFSSGGALLIQIWYMQGLILLILQMYVKLGVACPRGQCTVLQVIVLVPGSSTFLVGLFLLVRKSASAPLWRKKTWKEQIYEILKLSLSITWICLLF